MTEDVERFTIWFYPTTEEARLRLANKARAKGETPVTYPYRCYIGASINDVKAFFVESDKYNSWYKIASGISEHNYGNAISVEEWMKKYV